MKKRSKRYSIEFKQSPVYNDEKRSMFSISKWINDAKLVSVENGKSIIKK